MQWQRRWYDYLPIVGWCFLKRERPLHGRFFWIRPLAIEIAFAGASCALYYFHTQAGGTLPLGLRATVTGPPFHEWMHLLFCAHWLLLGLMMVATFIDFDEQTVPDWITVPGTLAGLTLSSLSFMTWLPILHFTADSTTVEPVFINAPGAWNPFWSSQDALWIGWGLFTSWCLALSHRRWIMRRGLRKAFEYFFAGWFRYTAWRILIPIWIVGSIGIFIVYQWGGMHWNGLISSLLGMSVGGGAVWAVRIIASKAMAQEAMGFGDVTLMAMIGTFIGWQASLMAFTLAPMIAILIVLIQFAITKNRAVPFGPYLCAGSMVTIVGWDYLWNRFGAPMFALGGILPVLLMSLLCLMGVMLITWRWIKETFIYGEE